MKSVDRVLQVVGNETRRKILNLLSEELHYISQLAKKLDVTQPAILKHLSLLEKCGLIESFRRKSPLGAARKYYRICDSVGIEIAINPARFMVAKQPRMISCSKYWETEGLIEKLTDEINKAEDLAGKAAKAAELLETANALLSCDDYEDGSWNCENCQRIMSLRREVSQVIIQVSKGEMDSGLRKLTETMSHLVSSLLPR